MLVAGVVGATLDVVTRGFGFVGIGASKFVVWKKRRLHLRLRVPVQRRSCKPPAAKPRPPKLRRPSFAGHLKRRL